MHILSLKIKNFRNHEEYSLNPEGGVNILLGKNGAGKTSILEACSLLLLGRSFKGGRQWVQEGKKSLHISLEFKKKEGEGRISFFLDGQGHKRFINEKPSRKKEEASCVFFSSEDLSSIRGEASYRRKLIDDLVVSSPKGFKTYKEFKSILNQRNKFLKLCKKGHYSPKDQKTYIKGVNEAFIEKSINLIHQRLRWLQKITPFWQKEGHQFLGTDQFSCQYIHTKRTWKEEMSLELEMAKELQKKQVIEKLQGTSLVGPHRDDLVFFLKKKEARHCISQGQQRALALSWKLAEWSLKKEMIQEPPTLFLDDVFSEIDPHFRKSLIQFLVKNEAQVFITTNETNELYDHHKINQIYVGDTSEPDRFIQTRSVEL